MRRAMFLPMVRGFSQRKTLMMRPVQNHIAGLTLRAASPVALNSARRHAREPSLRQQRLE